VRGILDVVAISCNTLAPVACCVGDTATYVSTNSQTMIQQLLKKSLPVADALTNVVNAIAYAVDNVTSHLSRAGDVALDLLAEPVVTHFA